MTDKALGTIRNYQMLRCGDTVVAAVSGGPDSMALLHFLWRHREELGVSLRAAHFNHCLRGRESERDAALVADWCALHQIPLTVRCEDIALRAERDRQSVELAARQARYELFEQLCREENTCVATAHHLSDQLETVLLNLARGSGLQGLCGIPPVRGRIIRPLLYCEKREILEYVGQNNIPWRQDESNENRAYRRNLIRHDVVPLLRQLNPSLERSVGKLVWSLTEDEQALDNWAALALRDSQQPDGVLLGGKLAPLPPAVHSRVWIRFLTDRGLPYDFDTVQRLRRLTEAGNGAEQIDGSHRITACDGTMRLVFRADEVPAFCLPLREGVLPLYGKKRMEVRLLCGETLENLKKNHKNVLKNWVDCDKISHNAIVRQRRDGDGIELWGRGVRKRLKKLLNEQKIDREAREKLAMIEDGGELVWVEGFGVSERAAVSPATVRALQIDVWEDA